uniref:GCK domain-containing protein n=1 Tax=Oryza rufipogon TaxID=4529 RepID=A0A0E0PYJ1_ORYRU
MPCGYGVPIISTESAKQCARGTAALRRCMEANAEHFKADIRAMDEGLDEDQRRLGFISLV